jgi:DNA-binding MarR family transcriptional regulator
MQRSERVENLFLSTQSLIRGWRTHFQKLLKPEHLSPTLMSMLFHISTEQPASGRSISAALQLSPSAVSQLIDGLAHMGYISRETRAEDRRVTYFGLTELGEKKVLDLQVKRHQFFMSVTEALSDSELDTMVRLQQKLIDEINKQSSQSSTGKKKEVKV